MMLMNTLFGVGHKADTQVAARETFTIASRRLELNPDDARAAYIGAQALIHLEDRQRAIKWLDIAARIDSTDPRTTYNLACGYSVLNDIDKAMEFLELSIEGGRPIRMMLWAKTDPDLQAVRADPRFAALMERWREAATGE
jgi:adenylate cyclase